MATFHIKSVSEKNTLNISKLFALKHNLETVKFTHVNFGLASKEVNINIVNDMDDNTIELSDHIIKDLKIPTFTSYQIKNEKNRLVIGPVIGVVLGKSKKVLYRKLRTLNSYVNLYDGLKGLIVGFTLEDLNRRKLTVNGLVYNPEIGIWERMEVPYPQSILKRGLVPKKDREYINSIYGDRFFNYKKVDKWEIQERLEQFPKINEYLPNSSLYTSVKDLHDFLNKYNNVYVKPIAGNQGVGIYNIRKNEGIITVSTRYKKENIVYTFDENTKFREFIKDNLVKNKYIIQETLDLIVKGRILDFRVGLDKNNKGLWQHNMFVTRVGGDESIVSNVASGGNVLLPIDALKDIYGLDSESATKKEKELLDIAYSIGECLDKTGIKLGKIALDLAITNDLKIYLIEINNTVPDDSLMKHLGDKEKIFKIRHENMQYAKYLAGFGEDSSSSVIIQYPYEWKEARYHLFIKANTEKVHKVQNTMKSYFSEINIDLKSEIRGVNVLLNFKSTDLELRSLFEFVKNDELVSNFVIVLEKKKTKRKSRKDTLLQSQEKEIMELKEEITSLKNGINNLKNSKSFKMTKPLRKIMRVVNKKS